MAKVLMPPHINSLDELLEMVIHPEKFTAYLTQLKDVRDAITTQLGVYATKDKAEEYLSQAQAKDTEAQASLNRARDIEEEKIRAGDAKMAELMRDQDAWTKAKQTEQSTFKERERQLTDYERSLHAQHQDLNIRAAQLDEQDAVLARLSAKLAAEQERLEKTKAVLNAIG